MHKPADSRKCSACGEEKPASEFSLRPSRPGGLEYRCKPCKRQQGLDWVKAHPEKYKEQYERAFRKNYPTPFGRARYMYNTARVHARTYGVPFDMSAAWILAKINVGICEVTGLPFDLTCWGKGQKSNAFGPSLDRIDPALGYVESNLRVVIWIYNRARGACQDEALLRMSRAMVAKFGANDSVASGVVPDRPAVSLPAS